MLFGDYFQILQVHVSSNVSRIDPSPAINSDQLRLSYYPDPTLPSEVSVLALQFLVLVSEFLGTRSGLAVVAYGSFGHPSARTKKPVLPIS